MYKCTECGSEYEIKPDYCDCGNDTFEQILKPNTQTPKQEQKPQIKQSSAERSTPKTQPQKTFKEQYPEIERFKQSLDPISTIIFITCIVFSIIAFFYIGKTDSDTTTRTEEVKEKTVQNIPPIDTYWDNTPIKPTTETVIPETKPVQNDLIEEIKQIIPIVNIQQPKPNPKQIQNVQKPVAKINTTTKTQTKTNSSKPTAAAQKQTTTTNKTSTADYSALTTRVQNNLKNNKQTQQAKNQTQNSTTKTQTANAINVATLPPIKTTTVTTQPSSQQQVTQIQQTQTYIPQKSTQQIKQELTTYKANLRNTIGRKIDFTKVVGDGECIVSFKINSSGRLTNRAFTKQSTNLTLNDAVYTALNSTPSFTAPPTGYNNETLNLKVKFYNGNFEISLY